MKVDWTSGFGGGRRILREAFVGPGSTVCSLNSARGFEFIGVRHMHARSGGVRKEILYV